MYMTIFGHLINWRLLKHELLSDICIKRCRPVADLWGKNFRVKLISQACLSEHEKGNTQIQAPQNGNLSILYKSILVSLIITILI